MKIYNIIGWALVLAYALACMYFAPPSIGPWLGLAIGAAYMVTSWFVGGVYLSCVIHMGIAHRALVHANGRIIVRKAREQPGPCQEMQDLHRGARQQEIGPGGFTCADHPAGIVIPGKKYCTTSPIA